MFSRKRKKTKKKKKNEIEKKSLIDPFDILGMTFPSYQTFSSVGKVLSDLFKRKPKNQKIEYYAKLENLLQQKLIEMVESYNPSTTKITNNNILRDDIKFFLCQVKEHQTNSLYRQHIKMRQSFSRSAKRFFLFYLVVVFGLTIFHSICAFFGELILPSSVLITMLGTVPINFIGLFAIILKDLFPKGEFPKGLALQNKISVGEEEDDDDDKKKKTAKKLKKKPSVKNSKKPQVKTKK